jgi:hypothetical protein
MDAEQALDHITTEIESVHRLTIAPDVRGELWYIIVTTREQAVAAERERAAKIAERIGTERDDGLAVNAGCEIAQTIREGK